MNTLIFIIFAAFFAKIQASETAYTYLIYLINRFPLDRNFKMIDEFRRIIIKYENNSLIKNMDRYEEYHQDQMGFLRRLDNRDFRTIKIMRPAVILQVENQLIHMQGLDVVQTATDVSHLPLCQQNETRISQKLHERNMPYKIGCLACAKPKFRMDTTHFRIHENRDKVWGNRENSTRDVLFLLEMLMKNYWNSSVILLLDRNIDEANMPSDPYEQEVLGVNIVPDYNPLQDFGELRVIPRIFPGLNTPDLNGLTVSCATNGMDEKMADEERVVIEADTLSHPNAARAWAENKTIESQRFRVGDYEIFNRFDALLYNASGAGYININAKWNLKLALSWAGWSCCSACCTEAIRGRMCHAVPSHRTRVGYVSVLKVNVSQPIDMHMEKQTNCHYLDENKQIVLNETCLSVINATIDELDRRLSSSLYASVGIPVFSTYFHFSEGRQLLEQILNKYFAYRGEWPSEEASKSASFPYGTLGQQIEVAECGRKNPQRRRCAELEKCLIAQESDRLRGFGLYHKVIHEDNPSRSPDYFLDEYDEAAMQSTEIPLLKQLCAGADFLEIIVLDQFAEYEVLEGVSYIFTIDEATFGRLSEPQWMYSRDELLELDEEESCLVQHCFWTEEGKHLIIVDLSAADTLQPYFVTFRAEIYDSESEQWISEDLTIRLDLILQRRIVESKVQSELLLWVGLIIIVMLFLMSFAFGFNMFTQYQSELRLKRQRTAGNEKILDSPKSQTGIALTPKRQKQQQQNQVGSSVGFAGIELDKLAVTKLE